MKKYKKFQIVIMKLVHDEQILKRLDEIKNKEDLIIKNYELLDFIKPRPAIVLRFFASKHNGEGKYLVIPMTSKRSILNWYGAEHPLRIEISNPNLKKPRNFLMLDNIKTVTESCLKTYLDRDGNEVVLPDDEKQSLKFQINEKLGNLIP